MVATEKSFSEPIKCPHCGNKAPMEVVASYRDGRDEVIDMGLYFYDHDAAFLYDLLLCPACHEITLGRYYWSDARLGDPIDRDILYPSTDEEPVGLPGPIARAFEAANRVRTIDPNSYGVLMWRLVEEIWEDCDADSLESLAESTKLREVQRKRKGRGTDPDKSTPQ
jgi:hypothetical protein